MAPPGLPQRLPSGSCRGSGQLFDERLDAARSPPTATLPLITDARRFSKMSEDRSSPLAGTTPQPVPKPVLGISPTISLETGKRSRSARLRVSRTQKARCTGVCSKSVRFMETWAMPRTGILLP